MTVTSAANRVNYVVEEGDDTFSYNFLIYEESECRLLLNDQVWNVPFTITGLRNPNGGNVTLETPIDANTAGKTFSILRNMPFTQLMDYEPYDAFPAASHEEALDRAIMLIQQQQDILVRCVRSPYAEDPAQQLISMQLPTIDNRKGKYLFFGDDGGVTVADSTDQGGIVVNSVTSGSEPLISVDNTDNKNPIIFISATNVPNSLAKVEPGGKIPQSIYDIGVATVGIDAGSTSMLFADSADSNNPKVGVQTPNLPLALAQVNASGKLPLSIIPTQGLDPLGTFRGDDLCPKPNDGNPGALPCAAPDHRNPSEALGTAFVNDLVNGSYMYITFADGETTGQMNVQTDDGVGKLQDVFPGDQLLYTVGQAGKADGWYHIATSTGSTLAVDVVYDPTGRRVLDPTDINVQVAINSLDDHIFDRLAGGTIAGDVQINAGFQVTVLQNPTSDDHLARKFYVDSAIVSGVSGLQGQIDTNAADIAQNVIDIAAVDARVDTNVTNINQNTADITALEAADVVLDGRITSNTSSINANTVEIATKISDDDYANSTTGGTLKVRLSGTNLYMTNNGSTP